MYIDFFLCIPVSRENALASLVGGAVDPPNPFTGTRTSRVGPRSPATHWGVAKGRVGGSCHHRGSEVWHLWQGSRHEQMEGVHHL